MKKYEHPCQVCADTEMQDQKYTLMGVHYEHWCFQQCIDCTFARFACLSHSKPDILGSSRVANTINYDTQKCNLTKPLRSN